MHTGLPTSFIRLTGCALRCTYCDTPYAFYGGSWQTFEEIFAWLGDRATPLVQITGGEPLHQKAVWPLVAELVTRGYEPLIETSGAVDINGLDPAAHIVLDIKTPESGEHDRMIWENLDALKPTDEVKFVVCSGEDLAWSLKIIRELDLCSRFQVLVSPVAEIADKTALAEQVLAARLPVRFQVQLHKILWGEEKGR